MMFKLFNSKFFFKNSKILFAKKRKKFFSFLNILFIQYCQEEVKRRKKKKQ